MPRFETPTRRDTGEKKKPNLFQRLGNRNSETGKNEQQEQPKKRMKLSDILGKAESPREKELVQKHHEVQKETRGLLSKLRENLDTTKNEKNNVFKKFTTKNADISKNPDAVRAYQEHIRTTDPERFEREIGKVDGIYRPKTRRAYEADKGVSMPTNKKEKNNGTRNNESDDKNNEGLKLQKGFRAVPLRFQKGLNKLIAERKRSGIEIDEKNPIAIYDSATKKLMLWNNGRMKILSATHGKGKLGNDTPKQYGTPFGAAAILENSSRVGSSPQDVLGGNGAIVGANIHINGLEAQNDNMLGRTVRIHGLPENYAYTNGCIGVMPQDVSKLMEWTKDLGKNPNQAYLYIT